MRSDFCAGNEGENEKEKLGEKKFWGPKKMESKQIIVFKSNCLLLFFFVSLGFFFSIFKWSRCISNKTGTLVKRHSEGYSELVVQSIKTNKK